MDGIKGWLLVYLIGSVPVLALYAAGLSGWFFNYPMGLFVGILLLLAVPLVLLVLKVSSAPQWNIVGLWVGAGPISVRVLHGVLLADPARLTKSAVLIMSVIVSIAISWAVVTSRLTNQRRPHRSRGHGGPHAVPDFSKPVCWPLGRPRRPTREAQDEGSLGLAPANPSVRRLPSLYTQEVNPVGLLTQAPRSNYW